MIRIQRLTKTYKQVTALAGIDLSIATGECFGLIGTNGSGRTTLLNIVATLVRATSGQVEIAGLDVLKHPLKVRQRLGYVAESHGFDEGLKVHEYLDFIASSRHLKAHHKAEAIDAALARIHLDPDGDIRTLSRGCRQQLAIAAALLHDPAVLLLDEPMTHLDPLARRRVRGWLQGLRSTTILLACNAAADLQGPCDRIGFLHHGRLLEVLEMAGEKVDVAAVLEQLIKKYTADGNAAGGL